MGLVCNSGICFFKENTLIQHKLLTQRVLMKFTRFIPIATLMLTSNALFSESFNWTGKAEKKFWSETDNWEEKQSPSNATDKLIFKDIKDISISNSINDIPNLIVDTIIFNNSTTVYDILAMTGVGRVWGSLPSR
jgi:hypothetical protein